MFRSVSKTKQLFKTTNKNTNFLRFYNIDPQDLKHVSSFPQEEQSKKKKKKKI